MTAKQYLSQIEVLDKRIQNKLSEEYQLRSLATNISVPSTSERVQTSNYGDRVANIVLKIVEVQSETERLVDNYLKQRSDIIHTIELLETLNCYDLLFKKYVEYKSLNDISKEMGYSLQHIKRLHRQAIEEVKKIKGFTS